MNLWDKLDEAVYGAAVACGLHPEAAWQLPIEHVVGVTHAQTQAAALLALFANAAFMAPGPVLDAARWVRRARSLAERFGKRFAAEVEVMRGEAEVKLAALAKRWPNRKAQ